MNVNEFQKTLMEHFERFYAEKKAEHPNGENIDDDEWTTRCGINAAMFSISTGMQSLAALYQQIRPATQKDQAALIQGTIDVFLGCVVLISTIGISMDEFCNGVIEIVKKQMESSSDDSTSVSEVENSEDLWPEYVEYTEGTLH